MKKRKRLIWVVASATLLAVFVGALFYLATREHPDYVQAAKLLPAARKEAEAMFSPLTWEEYREQNGIEFRDDTQGWRELVQSFPTGVGMFLGGRSPASTTSQDVFLAEEAWFRSLQEKVAQLKVHQVSREGVIMIWLSSETSGVAKALGIAIEGNAELGRIDDITQYAKAGYRIVALHLEEPAELSVLTGNLIQIMVTNAVLRAAVKNRHSPKVVAALQELLDEAPTLPDPGEISAGEARGFEHTVARLRELKSSEVEPWLEHNKTHGPLGEIVEKPLLDHLQELWEAVKSGEDRQVRRTGARTTAALEARLWEILLARAEALRSVSFETGEGAEKAKEAEAGFLKSTDPSYELALESFPITTIIDTLRRRSFYLQGAKVIIEMLRRFPEYEELPDAIPLDVEFVDPFGNDSPVLYRKTPTGFVVYSRSENQLDDGFVFDDPSVLESRYCGQLWSSAREDYGFIVSYDPITPIP